MASFLSRLMPAVITLRGTKRTFSSARRTAKRVAYLTDHPARFAPPKSIGRRVSVALTVDDGWPLYVLSPRGGAPGAPGTGGTADSAGSAGSQQVLYLHGGSWIGEIGATQWSFAAALVEQSGATVTVPIYPVAPVGTATEVTARVADLVERLHAEPTRVSLVGDSAGGTVVLATALELLRRGVRPLAVLVLVAPGLDLTFSDPRAADLESADPFLAAPGLRYAASLWAGGLSLDDARVSPLFASPADLSGLGPVTVFTGTRDILNPDAHRFTERARAAGVPVTLHEAEGMLHNYPVFPIPEGRAALAQIAALLR
ncbi:MULTISPECIES: alpha/beta hydrolase [Subtercola]|uniref:alpha/beta hydrolase n=1 Tax=Subtercola TaxID=120212 RepID=UPI001375B57B|nr:MULTISPECIES: alpha/beta hydrolase [Subtercola]MEA9986389.1 alpha/beta hydrolase [Subtercola sp. RTI3]